MLGQRSANLGIGRGAHVVDQLDGLIEFGLRYLSEVCALREETPQVTVDDGCNEGGS